MANTVISCDKRSALLNFTFFMTWQTHFDVLGRVNIKGQVQGSGWFLTWFPLKLAENNDVGETVIWGL